jgi:ABC-2 type transport system permease protein
VQAFIVLLRRELGSYFASVTGYLIIATVLFLLGLSFSEILRKLNAEPTDAPLTEQFFVTLYFWLILLLTAPIITMRTFAHEKFSGTYETLMTAPVRDGQVVMAKFFGALIFFAITWLPLLAYLLLVRRYSNDVTPVSFSIIGSTFLGLVLIGGLFMAIGCLASALARSQLTAAILSYAFSLALFLLSLRTVISAPGRGWSAQVFSYISMSEHMEDFARGVIDSRYIAFYFTLTSFFLFLTLKVVESRRWK